MNTKRLRPGELVDRSREALWVAMANAAKLGASVSFVQSDWFDALGEVASATDNFVSP